MMKQIAIAAIMGIEPIVTAGSSTPGGMAVDWVTRHLYWVEISLSQIEVANFNGTDRMTLVAGNMDSPRAIALDPRHG
jgi:integrin beta 2